MIRVMLVDDHPLVRTGLRMLLVDAGVEVVAGAGSGEQACQEYAGVQPDIVVMDLSMSAMGGLEALRRMLAPDPKARILALSAHEDAAHSRRVLRAGALGYLAQRSAPDALVVAVHTLSRGECYVDAQTAQAMALAEISGSASPADALTAREFSVFVQLAPSTVGTHLYHVK